jgi:hypothetical protein
MEPEVRTGAQRLTLSLPRRIREYGDALLQGENTPIILTEAFIPRNTENTAFGSQSTAVELGGVFKYEK